MKNLFLVTLLVFSTLTWSQSLRRRPIHTVDYPNPPRLENNHHLIDRLLNGQNHRGVDLSEARSRVHRIISQSYCPWICEIVIETSLEINSGDIICVTRLIKNQQQDAYQAAFDSCID